MSGPSHGLSRYDMLVRACDQHHALAIPFPQIFGRLGPRNPVTGTAPDGKPFDAKRVTEAFIAAVDGMRDETDPEGAAGAALTFFGQFIDHDVTLDTTSAIGTRIDPRTIRNVRTPGLDLDCVYGDGPEGSPHLYSPDHHGYLLYGTKSNPHDLARTCKGVALIGDPRNDENAVVSQLHGLFVALHNILMDALMKDESMVAAAFAGVRAQAVAEDMKAVDRPFEAARRIMRLHYHWLILNEFLPAFVDGEVLKTALHTIRKGRLPEPWTKDSPVMPVEFSGAAFRFGHATIRSRFRFNDAHPDVGLFEMGAFGAREASQNIAFGNLLAYPGGGAFQKARPVGRKLPAAIFSLPFVNSGLTIDGHELSVTEAKKLPARNLFRDRFALELPSGQQMARAMGAKEIAAPKELTKAGITKTPLWYYCLHEAEHFGGKLGPVGGGMVATVLIRLMALDHESLLCSAEDFTPWAALGATAKGEWSLGRMAQFVEENRDKVSVAAALRCPD
ncbi:MAG: peroxidase family protein [Pikeienuella sp.]|uniref:peroxidase family protein n=1 Tax=Pikeienuella sp. TaxID=2831957 RepID=UPI00391DBE1F